MGEQSFRHVLDVDFPLPLFVDSEDEEECLIYNWWIDFLEKLYYWWKCWKSEGPEVLWRCNKNLLDNCLYSVPYNQEIAAMSDDREIDTYRNFKRENCRFRCWRKTPYIQLINSKRNVFLEKYIFVENVKIQGPCNESLRYWRCSKRLIVFKIGSLLC